MPMTADLFHYGHFAAITKGSAYGEVIVGLLSDEDVYNEKGKYPILTWEERKRSVLCHPLVVDVVLLPVHMTREFHELHQFDLIVHGDDFSDTKIQYYYPYAWELGLYRAIPYEPGISTTEILQRIRPRLTKDEQDTSTIAAHA